MLGLLSAVRAVPLALVYGFLLTREPGRLLAAYLVGGLLVSLPVGIGAVLVLGASANTSDSSTSRSVIDVALGMCALVYAAGYAAGRFGTRTPDAGPGRFGALTDRLRHPSVPVAAAAGALTNLPGLYYLAGLVAILETQPGPVNAVLQVLVYNALRFVTPAAALAVVLVRPDRARDLAERASAWGLRRRRELVVGIAAAVGVYLLVEGLTGLLG